MQLTFATLMQVAGDEPDSMYGYAARSVRISADKLTYRFSLRPEARFHDGTKLTAHDVAFSLNILKEKGHPIITQLTRDLVGAEADDDETVILNSRRSAHATCRCLSASLPIFSRAYYSTRNFEETTLEAAARLRPLQGRPFRVRAATSNTSG